MTMSPILVGLAVMWRRGVPAAGEYGEAAFAHAAQAAQECVV
ncbi:hypothetical protein OH799_29965 [Nocardia sp. NBC_00881]|nr:hypothetical protein OH799_29965 [Nocardia sp. NBC_00881]